MSDKPTFQAADLPAPRPRPQTRRELFMATYTAAVARLRAEGKLPAITDNARQGAESVATAPPES